MTKKILDGFGEKWMTSGLIDSLENDTLKEKLGKGVEIQRENDDKKFFYLNDILDAVAGDTADQIKLILTNSDTGFSDAEERGILHQGHGESLEYFLNELRKCKENKEDVPAVLFVEMSQIMHDRYKKLIESVLEKNDMKGEVITLDVDNERRGDTELKETITSLI